MPITSYPGWVDKLRQGDSLRGTIDAYSTVPMLYRAVNLRCDAISTVPYTLFRGDEEAEWPFRQDLAQLIKDTERHLLLTGGAFWLKLRRGRVLTGFQLLNPLSMTVTFDARKAEPGNPYAGITFHQKVGETNYGPWSIEDIVYFREPSMQDEVRPGLAPAYVALESSRLAHYLERFVSHFFEGGAQPITVLNLPESMDESEFKRFQTEWTARFTGVINAFRTAFVRAPDLKVTTITPDINTLMLPELQERVITSISMTLGVPRTMLEASAANYATADSDRQSFWRETIVPRLSLYTQVLNNQLLEGLGYEVAFQPEQLDVLQADEASRAGSLLQLVQAGVPLRGAMMILGYDGIEDALGPEPAPIGVTEPQPTPPEPSPAPPTDDVVADAQTTEDAVASLRAEHWELLAKKLERRIKAGKSAVCGFESDAISQDEVKSVMARITPQMTVHEARHIVDEVKAVDDMTDDERRIYDKLVGEFRKRGEAWVRKILRNENVDPTLADIVAPVLNAELSRVAQAQIDTIGEDIGVPATDAAQDRVVDWLVDYVPMETRLIDATTAERIKKVIDAYRQTSGMTSQDVADMIRPSVDPARALMIARTETVRAQTQANVIYQGYLRDRGLNYERTWITERDDITCPICGPLDGTPESTWPADVAGGPPGHPNCRCSTALRLVRPAEPEPAPQQIEDDVPEVLRGSASEIANRIINLVPDSAKKAINDDVRLRQELEDLYTQRAKATDLQSQLLITKDINNKVSEINKNKSKISQQQDLTYKAVLPALQSQNPQQVQINFNARFTTREQADLSAIIQQTIGIAAQQSGGQPITINVELNPRRSVLGFYRPSNQTLYINKNSEASTIVHETVHAMQHQIGYGVQATNAYGDAKTAGKTPITASRGYKTYTGITDDDYTFRVYDAKLQGTMGKWCEILTTGIDSIMRWDSMKDRDLIELTTQIIKDGAK